MANPITVLIRGTAIKILICDAAAEDLEQSINELEDALELMKRRLAKLSNEGNMIYRQEGSDG